MTSGKGEFGGRRVLEGTVVSDKMEKTVLVTVRTSGRHRLYKKIIRRVKRFMAHDDEFDAHMGDVVRIVEAPPKSRKKRWRVVEVLFRADLPEVAASSIDLDLIGEVKKEEEAPAEPVAAAAPEEVAVSQPEALTDASSLAEEATAEVELPEEAEAAEPVEAAAEQDETETAEASEKIEEPPAETEPSAEATESGEEESEDK
ncbi:MAG: 30S ribosomal protein S17 [Chloroflexi bacterium]|nr:30S ribosomal protein S17 [Chloroflexota bacterium]